MSECCQTPSAQPTTDTPHGGIAALEPKYDTRIPRVDVINFFYTPGRKKGEVLEVNQTLNKKETWSIKRDLFIHGLITIQKKDPENPWSFYQIGGIHGLPYQPYDKDPSTAWIHRDKDWAGGYCHHGDVLFPTWHRPYILLFERAIINGAIEYVNSLDDYVLEEDENSHAKRDAALELCKQLRLPYLDWAGSYMRTHGLPDIFVNEQIVVNFPQVETLSNPLKGFTVPHEVGKVLTHGYQYNPTAKPHYVPPPQSATPYTPKGYSTVRYPDSEYQSNYQASQLGLMRGSNTSLLTQVLAVFGTPDWARFSNHIETQAGSEMRVGDSNSEKIHSYGNLSSIEGVHDMVHFYLGGPGGHMAYPDVAGLDPIFFFHHCNVDRLIALWQFIYDNDYYEVRKNQVAAGQEFPSGPYPNYKSWINGLYVDHEGTYSERPNTELHEESDLTPFRKKLNGTSIRKDKYGVLTPDWFTSKDVRSVTWDMNITYPELELAEKEKEKEKGEKKWGPVEMLRYITNVYRPLEDTEIRWFVNFSGIRKLSFRGPFTIRVFIDKKDASAKTPLEDTHYAGFLNVFARGEKVQCAKCTEDTKIRGTVDVTDALIRLGRINIPELCRAFIDPKSFANHIQNFNLDCLDVKDVKLIYVALDGVTELFPVARDEPTIINTAQLALNKYVEGQGAQTLIDEAKGITKAGKLENLKNNILPSLFLVEPEGQARISDRLWGQQGEDNKKILGSHGTWCVIDKQENKYYANKSK